METHLGVKESKRVMDKHHRTTSRLYCDFQQQYWHTVDPRLNKAIAESMKLMFNACPENEARHPMFLVPEHLR